MLTPFERNIEVWRQLWRVIERSQLLVQIVDARNPLRYRCIDLERYVESLPANPADLKTVHDDERSSFRGPRRTLLLINKADLLDEDQRIEWAKYFRAQGVRFAFFSAADESARQEAKAQRESRFADGAQDASAHDASSDPDSGSASSHGWATDDSDSSDDSAEANYSHAIIICLSRYIVRSARSAAKTKAPILCKVWGP